MRDILMVLLFAGILPMAVRFTWVAVMLWTWVSIMNPHRLTFGFAHDLPYAAAAAGAAFISLLINRDKLHFPRDASVTFLLLFIAWTCVTTAFAYYPGDSLVQLEKVAKIQVMTLVALAAIRERKHIELFVWINALSIGFYGVKGGIFTITTGGSERVWGPAGGFIEGNNELGLAMVMVIPLLNYLRLVSQNTWIRLGLVLTMLLTAVAVLGTHSRGAFLAIAAMAAFLWLRSHRKVLSGVAMLIIGSALLAFMPGNWEERMGTIKTYEEDGSAMGRINAWETAFNIANARATGAGYSMYTTEVFAVYAPRPAENRAADPRIARAAHSIYFQVLGEHGWVGLVLFMAIGAASFMRAGRLRREAQAAPETLWLHHLAGMIQVSMVGFAVGGAFLSLAYFDLPYNILVVVVACSYWMKEKRWTFETQGALGAGTPVGRLRPRRKLEGTHA
ncbi:MAG: putative O-glycosylation ligase, exosortase A system-associated [Hydrogenophaga sp.]|nr:putative O-glycosylation ligase, exosortase A system-associated [Hydrogenophaga sp.]